MKIELTTVEWRHVLEWCKSARDAERATAEQWSLFPIKAKPYHRRARTWVRLSTKIKEGLKRGPTKRKPKTSSSP